MSAHKKGNNNVGYVITLGNKRIYLAGDTDLIPEMKELHDINLAFLPIGEGKTAMDPQSAAEAANIIRPGIVIPTHYETGENKPADFSKLVDTSIIIKTLRK